MTEEKKLEPINPFEVKDNLLLPSMVAELNRGARNWSMALQPTFDVFIKEVQKFIARFNLILVIKDKDLEAKEGKFYLDLKFANKDANVDNCVCYIELEQVPPQIYDLRPDGAKLCSSIKIKFLSGEELEKK